jgi:hypothetical protein
LEDLRAVRDRSNGVPLEKLREVFGEPDNYIRRAIEPCERNLYREAYLLPSLHADKTQRLEARQWQQHASEVAIHKSGDGDQAEVSKAGRVQFALTVAEECGRPLGFAFRKEMSSPKWPCLWKPLSAGWGLRWHFPVLENWPFSPFVKRTDRLAQPLLLPELHLCVRDLKGSIDAKARAGQSLALAYFCLVESFTRSYASSFDHDEMETNIKAHFALLALVIDRIEAAILSVLTD